MELYTTSVCITAGSSFGIYNSGYGCLLPQHVSLRLRSIGCQQFYMIGSMDCLHIAFGAAFATQV